MGIEIRSPRDEELRDVLAAIESAFGSRLPRDEEGNLAAVRKTMPLNRVHVAFDDGRPVGAAAAWPLTLTVPGGEAPCPGVTWVAVLPSHRRRGLASELMRRQLDEIHGRGEPIAALWASESLIYGRFGYGLASFSHVLDAVRSSFALRDDPGPEGSVRLVTREEALELFPPVYDRARVGRIGFVARDRNWWEGQRLATYWDDPGSGTLFHAVLELDGQPEAYAVYRVKENWERSIPNGTVRVGEALGTSRRATREIWRFLFSIDLTATVYHGVHDPAGPLLHAVRDPRRLRLGLSDALWLRLVDVDAALRIRSWNGEDSLVAEVRDRFCPWNEGRLRLGAAAGRTDDPADLALDAADLASLYLGGVDAGALHAAGRIEERTPGAVERAAALFRTPLPPYCPEIF